MTARSSKPKRNASEIAPESGVASPEASLIKLGEMVSASASALRGMLGDDIMLVTVLAPALPCIKAVAGQMARLVEELVLDARASMKDGGLLLMETSTVQRGEADLPTWVMLSVTDSGGSTGDVDRASVVREIVDRHGGRVDIELEPGVRRSVRAYFPAVATDAEPG